MASFTVYFLYLVCTFHVTMEMYRQRTGQTRLDNASLIESDSFQVSCHFPNLFKGLSCPIGIKNGKIIKVYVKIAKSKNGLFET